MRRLAVAALLLTACRAAAPMPDVPAVVPSSPHAAPPWTSSVAVWVDPQTDAGMGGGEFMEKLVMQLPDALGAAGFKEAHQGDPGALALKVVSPESHFSSIEVAYSVTKDGRVLDSGHFDSGKLPCGENSQSCAAKVIVSRIEDAQAVAALAKPATAERAAPAVRAQLSGRLAVLELRNETQQLTDRDARYFTDVIRAAVLKLAPQLEVMTRENLLVLLKASGTDLASCEGECEVDTGRRIGADAIISGELVKVGTRYKLSLRMHDTHEGRLVGATLASGATVDELDESLGKAVPQLFTAAQ